MIKRITTLFFILVLFFSPSDVENIEANIGFMVVVDQVGSAGDPCGCSAPSYVSCYTGEWDGDTDVICTDSGTGTAQGTVSGAVIDTWANHGIPAPPSGVTYGIEIDATNDYVQWPIGNNDSDEYTVSIEIYMSATTATDVLGGFEDSDGDPYVNWRAWANNNTAVRHRGNGTSYEHNNATYLISDTTWHTIKFSSSVTTGEQSIKVDDNAWVDLTQAIDAFSTAAVYFYAGDGLSNGSVTDTYYIGEIITSDSYKDDTI